jgi:PAS domain S-box-containing protein
MVSGVDYNRLFEHLPEPCVVLDRDCRCLACNEAYLRATGRERDQIIGHPVLEVLQGRSDTSQSASSANALSDSLRQVLATRRPSVLALVPADEARAEVERELRYWTNTPILDDSGEVELIIQSSAGVLRAEWSERLGKWAPCVLVPSHRLDNDYSELQACLERLRNSIDQAPGYVVVTRGPAHVVELTNRAVRMVPGRGNPVDKTFAEAFPGLNLQGLTALLDNVYASGRAYVGRNVHTVFRRSPGGAPEEVTVDIVCQPIIEGACVTGIYLQGYEVRASMIVQRGALLELLPAFVFVSNPNGMLAFVNDQTLEYFNTTRDQVLGNGWHNFVAPDDLAGLVEAWTCALTSGEPFEREFRLRRADGKYRWYLSRAVSRRDDAGVITEWIGANIDIDDTRQACGKLEQRAAYEKYLIGIVSHDLRSPLSAIELAATLLLEGEPPDTEDRRLLEKIAQSAQRATRMVRDLMDVAQARSERGIPINPRLTDLQDVVRQVVDELQTTHPTREVSIEWATDDTSALCDPERVAQGLANLIGNALQHSPSESTIRVRLTGTSDTIAIEVHNEGPAISPEDLDLLFEPFWRGKTAKSHGLGLGLFIARSIVVAHQGSLDVRSAPEAGTSFTVQLPRRLVVGPPPAAA